MNHIRRLEQDDFPEAMQLYYDTMKTDPYMALFFGKEPTIQEYLDTFGDLVHQLILNGLSYCYVDDNCFIRGILFSFDYNSWSIVNDEYINGSIFANEGGGARWSKVVKSYLDEQRMKTLYMLEVAVDESCRKQGIATQLVDRLATDFGEEYSIVADLSNPISETICKKAGYTIYTIDGIPIARKLRSGRCV